MKKIIKILNHRLLPLYFLGFVLFFSGCKSSSYLVKLPSVKKWINWEITFKENTSDTAKAKAFVLLEKYIIDDYFEFYRINPLIHLSFKIIPSSVGKKNTYDFNVSFDPGDASQSGFATVKPPPRGPKRDLLIAFPTFEDVKPILPNHQYGTFEIH